MYRWGGVTNGFVSKVFTLLSRLTVHQHIQYKVVSVTYTAPFKPLDLSHSPATMYTHHPSARFYSVVTSYIFVYRLQSPLLNFLLLHSLCCIHNEIPKTLRQFVYNSTWLVNNLSA